MFMNTCKIVIFAGLLSFTAPLFATDKVKISLKEASEFIRKTTKGSILTTSTSTINGVKTHRFKVLTPSGRVQIFQVPIYRNKNHTSLDYIRNGKRYSNDHRLQGSASHSRTHSASQQPYSNHNNRNQTTTPKTSTRTTKQR